MGLQEGPCQGFSVSYLFLLPCLHSPPGKDCFFSLEGLFLGLLLEQSGARLGLGLAAGCWLVGASGSCICLFSGVTGIGVLAEGGRQRLETLRPYASGLKLVRAPLTPEGESGNVGNLGTVFGSSVFFSDPDEAVGRLPGTSQSSLPMTWRQSGGFGCWDQDRAVGFLPAQILPDGLSLFLMGCCGQTWAGGSGQSNW